MGSRFAHWAIRWRYLVCVVTLAVIAVVGSGARTLHFDSDYRVWFSKDNPQLTSFEAIQNTYSKHDNVLFVLTPRSGEVFSADTLAAVEWLTKEAWQVPYSFRVDSLSNFQHTRALKDDLVVGDLYSDAHDLTSADIDAIRTVARTEPLLRNRLVSERGHVTGINVTVQTPGLRTDYEVPEIVDFVRDLAQRFRERHPEIEVRLTGIVMMNNAFPEASRHDVMTLVPLMFAVVIVALGLMTRSVAGTLGAVLVTAFAAIFAMGVAGWMGIKLTGASASAPTIILTLAVADSVHILTNFVHAMHGGMNKADALIRSLRINLQPVFLTSLTTAVGFLSMNLGDVPPFRDMGNLVAVGVAAAFVLSVTFLPAFLMLMPVHIKPKKAKGGGAMERIADVVIAHRRALLWGLGPLMLVLMACMTRNEFNDEFVSYFDHSIDFRRATDYTTANLTGITTFHYSLESGQSGGISEPDFLATVGRFAEWFRGQPEVVHVNTITDTLKRLNMNLHGDDADWYRLPEARETAAQYLLLYEMSLPYGLDLNDQINVDKSATRFVVTTQNLSTRETLDLDRRAQEWLRENAGSTLRDITASSPHVMFSYITGRNIRSMLIGTTTALILIALILIVALRSFKIGLISMVPNVVPAGLAFGLWGLMVGHVGLAVSVVSAVSLGIIVDDTVHFLSKYMRARKEENMDPPAAVRYAFSTVGLALWVTSVVLVLGFLILAQSAYLVNMHMGLLTATTISFALLADFFFLPPLLMAIDGDDSDPQQVASTPLSAEI
jgi:predicted RND superfamily exporter protein